MTNNPLSKDQTTDRQKKNAFQISVITFVATGSIAIYYTVLGLAEATQWSLGSANILAAIVSFFSLFSIWLNKRGRSNLGIALILISFSFAVIMVMLFSAGTDILLIAIILVVIFGLASTTLPSKQATRAIQGSFALALLLVAISFFEPFERTYYPNDIGTTFISIFLFAIYGVLIFRQFRTYPLRTKLVVSFVFMSIITVSVSFVFANFNMHNILEENAEQRLLAGASASAQNVDSFLSYAQDSISSASTFVDLNAYLLVPEEERHGSIVKTQAQNLLFALKNRNNDIVSYAILDINGNNILDSHTRNIGQNEAEYNYFQIPATQSGSYISSLIYLPNNDTPSLFLSSSMSDNMGLPIGILRVQYKASVLQDIIEQSTEIAGTGSFIALLDENRIIMAHGFNQALIGKFPVAPDENTIELLKNRYVLPANQPNNTFSLNRTAIDAGLNQFTETPYFSSPAGAENEPIFGAVTQLKETTWLIAAVQPQEIFLAPTQSQARITLSVSIAIIIFAAISGLGLAHLLTVPVTRLQTIAQKLSDGDLSVQASVETDDEVGALARTFNAMASRLQETITTLEERVRTRTKDLEVRTSYLEGAAEVSHTVSSIMDPNILATEVTDLIKEHFDLYYAGLFLVDRKQEWAVLKAGTGEAGQRMLAREHKIKIGEGMIGWCVENAEARIALDVGEDAVRFENPDLPETRSEGALPLRSRGRVLGALTVQSIEEAAFDESIITTLQTMADQVAVAFDNAELFIQAEAALLSERKAYGQLSQRSWQELTQSHAIPRFIVEEDGTTTSVISTKETANPTELLEDSGMTAIIPIKNRDYLLGGIKIRKTKGAKPWTKEELEITQAISEQLSVTLESARLFEETQRKAEREIILSDISAKIGSSIRMESILRTTVQELGQALGSPEVTFELTDPEKEDKTS